MSPALVLGDESNDVRLFGKGLGDLAPDEEGEAFLWETFTQMVIEAHDEEADLDTQLLIIKIGHVMALKLIRCGFFKEFAFADAVVVENFVRLDVEHEFRAEVEGQEEELSLSFTLLIEESTDLEGFDSCVAIFDSGDFDYQEEMDTFVQEFIANGGNFDEEDTAN